MMNKNSNGNREKMLQKINEVSFAVNDILLFLDTHPDCEDALNYYHEMCTQRKQCLEEYAAMYGPLTIDTAIMSEENCWKWALQPFPWESEGGRR